VGGIGRGGGEGGGEGGSAVKANVYKGPNAEGRKGLKGPFGFAIRQENNKSRVPVSLPHSPSFPHPFPSFCFAQLGMPLPISHHAVPS